MDGDELRREDYRGFSIKLLIDRDPPDPRKEQDNLGTMVCLHRRYKLGDTNDISLEEANELEARVAGEGGVVLKLYLYDHSGITISCEPFSCPWDSGRIGFVYVEKGKMTEEYGFTRYPQLNREKAEKLLRAEVAVYDTYLTGGYCGYVVEDEEGEEVDSCWGYDDQEYALSEAKAHVDWELKERGRKAEEAEESVAGS